MRRTLFAIVSLAAGLWGSQALAQDMLAACSAVADGMGHPASDAAATMAFGPTALLAFMPTDGGSNTDSFTCTFADGRQPALTKLTWTLGSSNKEEALDLDAANAILADYYAKLPPEAEKEASPSDSIFADKPPEAEEDVLIGACRAIADDQGYTVPNFTSSFRSANSIAMSRIHPDGAAGTLTCVFDAADDGRPTLASLTWTASDQSVTDLDTEFLAPVLSDYYDKRAALAASQ